VDTFCVAWTRLEAYAKAITDGLGGNAAAARCCPVRSFRLGGDLVVALAESGQTPRKLRTFGMRAGEVAT
jgi:hypothetical protein